MVDAITAAKILKKGLLLAGKDLSASNLDDLGFSCSNLTKANHLSARLHYAIPTGYPRMGCSIKRPAFKSVADIACWAIKG